MRRIKELFLIGRRANPILPLLILLLGVSGILLFLRGIEGVYYPGWIVYLFTVLFSAFLWFSWSVRDRKRTVFWLGLLIVTLPFIGLAALNYTGLEAEISHILRCLKGDGGAETMDITGSAFLIGYLASLLLFTMEFILNWHPVLCLITMALVFLSPLAGIRISGWVFLLLLLFQGTFLIVFLFQRMERGRRLRGGRSISILWKSVGLAGAFLILAFFTVAPFALSYSDTLYQVVYDAEGYLYRSVMNLSGRTDNPVTGGTVSGGNNYQTGTVHLELTASQAPTETLYLKGFTGGEYTGGDWLSSTDEEIFEEMENYLGWRAEALSAIYYTMYFTLNELTSSDGDSESIFLHISHSSGSYEYIYAPYYGQINSDSILDGWNRQTGEFTGYGYDYYEQSDMHIDWDNVLPDYAQLAWVCQIFQDAYMEEIQEAYTQVPTYLLPRLTQLVEDNPLDDLDDITAFILYTLHSNATYSLTPGWAPLNEDIVEYFLFEGQTGYCVHFAATATLLYRLYGIPARYVTGYMVEPESFQLQDDGSYYAEVTDESAHAWVEIFLPDYGWTPVDVTPASDGSAVASYPGFDSEKLEQLLQDNDWNMNVPSLSGTEMAETGQTGGNTEYLSIQEQLQKIDWAQYKGMLLILGSCLICVALLSPLLLDYRRLRKYRRMKGMSYRRIFGRLLDMLHWCGLLSGMDGTEKDFQQRLIEAVPECDGERTAAFLKRVREEAYGPNVPSDKGDDGAFRYYCDVSKLLYDRQSFWKRVKFRYLKGF